MKPFFMIFSLLLLFSCGDSDTNVEKNNGTSNGDGANNGVDLTDFDCSTTFDKGDYSTACFSEGTLPEFSQTSISPTVCFYKIGKLENTVRSLITVHVSVHEPDIVKQLFATFRTIGTGTMVEIQGVGDEAFLDIENSTKTLTVRTSNIMLTFVVQDDTPCLFEDDELKTFAKLVVSNLN